MTISDKLKQDLINDMDVERVFQKHVVDGASYLFGLAPYTIDQEYELRHDIATATATSINDVILVGSSKLGFSVKSEDFKEFDKKFVTSGLKKDKSDVDIALINRAYFEEVAEEIYHLSGHFKKEWIREKWVTNQYYIEGKSLFHEYTKYLAMGWLRPDFMPNEYLATAAWPEICEKWRKRLDRNVAIGIYSSWTYLKHYHMDHLKSLKSKLSTLEIK